MTWAPDYTTTALLKNYLNIQHDDDDLWIANWVTTVSRNIDDFCGRQFGQVAVAEERSYTPKWDVNLCRSYVEIDDLQDITSFALEDSYGTAITDYTFEPKNAIVKGSVYTRLYVETRYVRDLVATGKWGWNAVPSAVPTGLYIQASRLKARRNSPFGVAGSPETGSEIRLLAQLDPDFKTSLKPLVRKWYVR
jgi:hypothetical protein